MRTRPPEPRTKPLKRPSQARAKVTVQAIFDTYVRIWQRDGWERINTRAIALECGIAVGTLYDYFPSKMALHSGYIRHCIEALIQQVQQSAVEPKDLNWEERLHRLLQLVCGLERSGLPWFHPKLIELEPTVAEHKHQQRAHIELKQMWLRVFEACDDLPRPVSAETIEALHLAVWGGRRYSILLQLGEDEIQSWAREMERMCRGVVLGCSESEQQR
ncbi:TetR/AcrR family transcriptional regulator [Pseudomonas sp. OIL-1]|uniref:TetR/AcrR family transcriptional regulator n=1 Tax=Pseudomonas sp. OIL-1 TaxID=2706126 RepID=UPI0013A7861F|nr:TetR/AcrR family transcriptional regulator [Pseudomonas sp. OIL-1]QIB51907.1 TetR/AcrR family transcriptional regulator [Pseudomonas sp. OIL-1]